MQIFRQRPLGYTAAELSNSARICSE
jgi:hypothetical protein